MRCNRHLGKGQGTGDVIMVLKKGRDGQVRRHCNRHWENGRGGGEARMVLRR